MLHGGRVGLLDGSVAPLAVAGREATGLIAYRLWLPPELELLPFRTPKTGDIGSNIGNNRADGCDWLVLLLLADLEWLLLIELVG